MEDMHARLSAAIRKGKRIEAELRAKEAALAAAQQQIVELDSRIVHMDEDKQQVR
jgi:hypothetical protein